MRLRRASRLPERYRDQEEWQAQVPAECLEEVRIRIAEFSGGLFIREEDTLLYYIELVVVCKSLHHTRCHPPPNYSH
jgi:hypothetical protein